MTFAASHLSADQTPSSRPDYNSDHSSLSSTEDVDGVRATATFEAAFPFLVLSVDGSMCKMTGYGASHMVGRSVRVFQNPGEDPLDILWAAQAASTGRTVCIQSTLTHSVGAKVAFRAQLRLDNSSSHGPLLRMTATEAPDVSSIHHSLATYWSREGRSTRTSSGERTGRSSPDIDLMLTAEESAQADFVDPCVDVSVDSRSVGIKQIEMFNFETGARAASI
eukprot:535808-Rhodomonas_salina.1